MSVGKVADAKRDRSPSGTRAPAPAAGASAQMALAQTVGNRALQRLIQAKLTFSRPGDPFEQEADRAADAIFRSPAPPCHCGGICASCRQTNHEDTVDPALPAADAPIVQTKLTVNLSAGADASRTQEPGVEPQVHQRLARATVSGHPLAPGIRMSMERAFGADFSAVRIHADHDSHDLSRTFQAQAFTTGQHIFFRQGTYDPGGALGGRLLAHELTHVVQQTGAQAGPDRHHPHGAAARVIQRQPTPDPAAAHVEFEEEVIPEDEPRRHRWLNYDQAIQQNRSWFDQLHLAGVNPFAPYNPYDTPNAFVHRVLRWQQAADREHLAELVFAAEDAQRPIRSGSLASTAAGVEEVIGRLHAREQVDMGRRVAPDGVLGPRTFWMMLVAAAFSTSEQGRQALRRMRLPLDVLEPLTRENTTEWRDAWNAVHAYLFNPPQLRANWSALVRADVVFKVYDEIIGYSPDVREYLIATFFPGGSPETIENEDLTAILSRGYADEVLEGIVTVVEVDRDYFGAVDVRKVIEGRRREWLRTRNVNMGTAHAEEAAEIIAEFGLGAPTGAQADAALARLSTQGDWQQRRGGPTSVLVATFPLPEKPAGFWEETASRYIAERALLERAAEEATEAHLQALEQRFQQRMKAATPDIGPSANDSLAFLELLVGPVFESAQERRMAAERRAAQGIDIDLSPRWQRARQSSKVNALMTRATEEQFLVVQLGDQTTERFPLSLRQIERSRRQAETNGGEPLMFDLLDTPQAAFHMYTPTRFTARGATDGAAQVARNPYELVEGGRSWESWRFHPGRIYQQLEPALVELHEFNPDAGKLVQWYRQLIGTDRIIFRFVWTLGGALPKFSEALWEAQTRINIVGWVDAVLTTFALASVVAAPLGAGASGGGAAVGGQVVQAAAAAAARRALLLALRRFVISEAISEILGRITWALNDDESVPEGVKTVWNGLMVALLIYGVGATLRQGVRAIRIRITTARLLRELDALEAAMEAEARAGARADPSAAEAAAQADIRQRTETRHRELVGEELGGAPATGAGRVRSADPRAAAVAGEAPSARLLTPELETRLRTVLGDDLATALATTASDATRRRLALIESDEAIRRLNQALSGDELATALARLDAVTLARLGAALEAPVLRTLMTGLMGSTRGLSLLRVFSNHGPLLARLMDRLTPRTLLALADDPGAQRLFRLAERVDADAIADALRSIGSNRAQSLDRLRQMVRDIGPEATADVLNTYAGWEIKNRFRRGSGAHSGLSPAQNVGRLAIQRRLQPTVARQRTGVPVTAPAPSRPPTFTASDVPEFYAIGPEATAPSILREQVAQLKVATARAANQLDDLMHRSVLGTLTPAEIQALPPNARATIEAFLRTGPGDSNHHALYGSALQYLAEFKLAEMFGGALPPGVAIRRREYRVGQTLIPDAQIEITLTTDLRYPGRNTVERAVIDWTTTGEVGKIAKYRGGTPPVTYAVELIQPGPPRVTPQAATPTTTPTPTTIPTPDPRLPIPTLPPVPPPTIPPDTGRDDESLNPHGGG